MFFRKPSPLKEARQQADNLLRLADKVDAYRRDVMTPEQLGAMRAAAQRVQQLSKQEQTTAGDLDIASEALHEVMKDCGADIYPLTFWGENVEMLMVAAILAIGIRTFFLQPFRIPTNSMFPTYYGMTPYVYALDQPGPTVPERAWNLVVHGASHYQIRSEAEGEVRFEVNTGSEMTSAASRTVETRKWFGLMPDRAREYTLFVGAQEVKLQVPVDFILDKVLFESFFPGDPLPAWQSQGMPTRYLADRNRIKAEPNGRNYVATGRYVKKGDLLLDFDIRTGDMLFVDRLSYNFISPKVGDPFVFSTSGIPRLVEDHEDNMYFIKRLVGLPGDTLQVRPSVLYRNGKPIDESAPGVKAFYFDDHKEKGYPGYVAVMALSPGQIVTVKPGYFYAMGDNSPSSKDSRYWGGVPAQNVMGRAVLIVYPFSSRWGLAK